MGKEDTTQRDILICKMYEHGYKINDIEERVGISRSTLYSVLKREGIDLRLEVRREHMGEQVKKVVRLFDSGVPLKDIGSKVELTNKEIAKLLWKVRPNEMRVRVEKEKRIATKGGAKFTPANESTRNFLDRVKDDDVRVTLMKNTLSEDEFDDVLIMRDYLSGVSFKGLQEKYEVPDNYLEGLLGGESEDPKYLGYEPINLGD